jgi:hypothetical protein
MVSLVLVSSLGILALAAMVWCFLGFTRALHEPPKIAGWLFQLQPNSGNARKWQATILEFPFNHTSAADRMRREKLEGISGHSHTSANR